MGLGTPIADKKVVHPILVTAGAAPAGVSQEDTTATAPTTTKNEPKKKKKKNQNKASYQKLQAEEKAIDDVELANEFWERAEAPTQTEPPARQDTIISIDSVDTIVVPMPGEK
ncbi:hypothetical protein BGW42_001500 [Actinomortierella wolfii]|nr:hypothetical protein BGW42_001500 [Actinomortierella wolfii]